MLGALTHVLWIGGPAAAGKTTVSRLLARRHGLRWYSTDAHTADHEDRAVAAGSHVAGSGPGSFDRAPMILEDLASLPMTSLIVVEGAHLRPQMGLPVDRALWLMPSKPEQRRRLQKRHPEGVHEGFLLGWTSFAEQLADSAVTTLSVDRQTVGETIAAAEAVFANALHIGPTAQEIEERQSLLRYGNQVIVWHALARLDSGFLAGALGSIIRTFDCECGDKRCDAFADLSLAEALTALDRPAPSLLACTRVDQRTSPPGV